MFPCFFKYLTGFDCPGCGIQRSVWLLLQGRVQDSIAMYWATIPILIMLTYLLFYLKYRFKGGLQHLIFLFSANGILIIGHYFYKISDHL